MINVGLIGIGYWGKNLLRKLLENNSVNISVLCDSNEKQLIEIAKNFRLYGKSILISCYRDIKFSEVDAVVIATPAFTHHEIAEHFLKMRKHCLVEKPLTMGVDGARNLCTISNKNKVKLMVSHTFLYNPAVRKLKELVDKEKIQYIYFQRLNLGRVQTDINAMWSLAPHDISISNYLMGETTDKVSAYGYSFTNKNIDDVVFLNLEYNNNRYTHIHVSWIDPSKTRKCTVITDKHMYIYDDTDNEAPIKIYDKGIDANYLPDNPEKAYGIKLRSGDINIPKISNKEPLKEEIDHFINCIINDEEPLTNGANGWEVVGILEKAQEQLLP